MSQGGGKDESRTSQDVDAGVATPSVATGGRCPSSTILFRSDMISSAPERMATVPIIRKYEWLDRRPLLLCLGNASKITRARSTSLISQYSFSSSSSVAPSRTTPEDGRNEQK